MDTYGDMVTLLMTFFVMLYSMSNMDAKKWDIFVRSINPDKVMETVDDVNLGLIDPDAEDPSMTEDPTIIEGEDMDTLYLTIARLLEENGAEGVTVSKGEGYIYIRFNDSVFFGGNETELTESGKVVLAAFCSAIDPVSDQISQLNVMAHTAQARQNELNDPRGDRMISAMRGSEVCIFIQEKGIIEPDKLINISYGQFRPIAPNDTEEERAQNRRVEILLVEDGSPERSISEYLEEYNSGANADSTVITGNRDFSEAEPSPEYAPDTIEPPQE